MVRSYWLVLSKRVIQDQQTNNLSLLDVVEQIGLPRPPPEIPRPFGVAIELEATVLLEGEGDNIGYRYRIDVMAPDQRLASVEQDLDFKNFKRLRARFKFQGFPISVEGRYRLVGFLKGPDDPEWRQELETPLEVAFT